MKFKYITSRIIILHSIDMQAPTCWGQSYRQACLAPLSKLEAVSLCNSYGCCLQKGPPIAAIHGIVPIMHFHGLCALEVLPSSMLLLKKSLIIK